MTPRSSLAALLVTLSLSSTLHAAGPRLLAYYGFWDQWNDPPYTSRNIPYHQLTHIIHSNIAPAPSGDGRLNIFKGFLDPELISRAHAAGVKVEVCVAGNPNLFVKIDADPQLRATFAQNIADFAISHGYDGVDFDYEVPNDNQQARQFTLLIRDLRDLLPAGQYLISAAVSSSPGSYGIYDFEGMTPLLDFYNVMTYDFHGAWTNHAGHNSPLYLSPLDPGQEGSLSTSAGEFLNDFAVPAEQVNLGTAFYGYAFDVFTLWDFCTKKRLCGYMEGGVPTLTYVQAEQLIASGDWREDFDDIASAPYLTDASGETFGFVTYDNPSSTRTKVTFALTQLNLGGVFMWELSQDYDGKTQPLVNAMHEAWMETQQGR